ncbi:MAG: radical SAM protein [Lachnospiraceae bacterium]|nr:radical SAM protein [Lachnospiraceae bacterium]
MHIFQKGFNFGQDGPGNRLVYHLQGCNMKCIWCSNPEGMSISGGKYFSVDALLDECKRSRLMFYKGGGVTFTGGEATLQAEELLDLLKKLKEAEIHTALETNGTSPRLMELLPFIDYLMMDFKHYDSDILKKYTGMGNEQTKRNYEKICGLNRQVHIRIPLINGINAQNPEAFAFAAYLAGYSNPNAVYEFLPYHEYGKEKWTQKYLVSDGFVTGETVALFKKTFEEHGLKIIAT